VTLLTQVYWDIILRSENLGLAFRDRGLTIRGLERLDVVTQI